MTTLAHDGTRDGLRFALGKNLPSRRSMPKTETGAAAGNLRIVQRTFEVTP